MSFTPDKNKFYSQILIHEGHITFYIIKENELYPSFKLWSDWGRELKKKGIDIATGVPITKKDEKFLKAELKKRGFIGAYREANSTFEAQRELVSFYEFMDTRKLGSYSKFLNL